VVRDILERAGRAPSGGNLQPWRVDALSGAPLEALKALIRPRHGEIAARGGRRIRDLSRAAAGALCRAALRGRRAALPCARDSVPGRPARIAQYARNFEFFDAPVGLFVSIDRRWDRRSGRT